MNVIIAYLETMFSAYPQTPRLLEAKSELRGMMEDAYANLIAEGHSENEAVGQVIRDFGNLEEIAPALGITSDITPADTRLPGTPAPEPQAAAPAAAPSQPLPQVTIEEAQGYAEAQRSIRFQVSTAVTLFVLSPAALIALPAAAESGVVPLSPSAAVFVGLLALFALVAIGVMLLITTSRATARYRHIREGRFTPTPAVSAWAGGLAERNEPQRTRALQFAIALWILAPIPLIAFALLLEKSPLRGFWTVIGVVLVLALAAAGLAVLLPSAWAHTAAERLSRPAGAVAQEDSGERSIVGVIASLYWPLLTAVYLAWSFIGNAWGISWVLWPIGAVLFGAISAGASAIESYRGTRR